MKNKKKDKKVVKSRDRIKVGKEQPSILEKLSIKSSKERRVGVGGARRYCMCGPAQWYRNRYKCGTAQYDECGSAQE